MQSFDFFSIREYFPSPENPSTSTWVFGQAKAIQQFGINPLVVSPTPVVPQIVRRLIKNKHAWRIKSSTLIKEYFGVNVIRPPYVKLPKYFFDFNIKQISNCITSTSINFDAKFIHAHFGHAGVASLRLKKEKKIPLITSFYGFDLGSDKLPLAKYYKVLAKEGDLFLALSEDMKKDLIETGFPLEKILIHHLGIDLSVFSPNLIKKKEGDSFIFTIVASFEERKGIHIAIKAFKLFKHRHSIKNCQLRIVGDGWYFSNLVSLSGNDEDIIFINNFIAENPRSIVLQEMQQCDVFILTSITLPNSEKEGTPVVLMEAQACGKPCISSIHAGIPEVVIDNKTGILVKERDVEGIAKAMLILYSDSEMRENYGNNARHHIEAAFNNELQMPELFKIYSRFLISKKTS